MITNKDINITPDGSIILNGNKYPLASQAEIDAVVDTIGDITQTGVTGADVATQIGALQTEIGDITQTGVTGADVAAQIGALDTTIGDITQSGVTGATVAAQIGTLGDKIKKLPTQTTRYTFTAANTFEYTGVNVVCPTGHTYLVCTRVAFSNSEPKGIIASTASDNIRLFDCLAREEATNTAFFMLNAGVTAYIWAKGAQTLGDDIIVDIIDITN